LLDSLLQETDKILNGFVITKSSRGGIPWLPEKGFGPNSSSSSAAAKELVSS